MYKALETLKDSTYIFNNIAGNDREVALDKIRSQARLIKEESQETLDAANLNLPEEVLDGACDVLVTVFGLIQQLEALGVDTDNAMKKVAKNNLSKFSGDHQMMLDSVSYYKDRGEQVVCAYSTRHQMFYLRDTKGKIRKPITYVKVDLSDCIPDNLKDGFGER